MAKVIGVYAYPGDELAGTFTKFDDIDEFIFLFSTANRGMVRAKSSKNTIIIMERGRSPPPFPWRCGNLLQEAIEDRISAGDVVYAPAFSEREDMRQAVMTTIQRIYARKNYSFKIIDYSVHGIQPKSKRAYLNDETKAKRKELARKKYGNSKLEFRLFEEFHDRVNPDDEKEADE